MDGMSSVLKLKQTVNDEGLDYSSNSGDEEERWGNSKVSINSNWIWPLRKNSH